MKNRAFVPLIVFFAAISCLPRTSAQDETDRYWKPAGAPGTQEGKMKTLNEIESRTIITNLPYRIQSAGSYYLIGPLTGVTKKEGISISASDVRLDLNGYSLNGVTGSLDGVVVIAPCENISIRNGVIRDWGQGGVNATNASDVVMTDVKAFGNGWGGLYAGQNALISRCSAFGNGLLANSESKQDQPVDDAIQAGSFSTIEDCKVLQNRGAGIHIYSHCRVTGCTAVGSGGADGIHAEEYCTIQDCTAAQNKSHGIRILSRCRVLENTCGENGVATNTPLGSVGGISVEGYNNLIERNIVSGNNAGIKVSGAGNLIIHNSASRNGVDFMMPVGPASNFVGKVSSFTTSSSGGEFTNSNPWANFSFGGP